MPMPPPKPSAEGPRDRQVVHEIGQLVRAVEHTFPCQPDELARLVGAAHLSRGVSSAPSPSLSPTVGSCPVRGACCTPPSEGSPPYALPVPPETTGPA
ncbi:MAG: hypothetical protein JWQ93_79 [Marmoricola sp.]|jgi:hypothetical protein|nr:hypothetical protein [Marmoricola sp.]